MTASQESATSYQELPAKCWKGVEKLDYFAFKKEPSRDGYYYKVTTLREVFFDDLI